MKKWILILLATLASAGAAQGQVIEKKSLDLDGARKVIAAARAEARGAASAQQDEELAVAGAKALSGSGAAVHYYPGAGVRRRGEYLHWKSPHRGALQTPDARLRRDHPQRPDADGRSQ